MRSKYLVIFVMGLSFVNQIDAQENEAIENIIVSASKNEQKLEDVITPALVINEMKLLRVDLDRFQIFFIVSGGSMFLKMEGLVN